jgi:hypothetical protein
MRSLQSELGSRWERPATRWSCMKHRYYEGSATVDSFLDAEYCRALLAVDRWGDVGDVGDTTEP